MRKKKLIKLILIIAAALLLAGAACYTVFIAPLMEKEEWVYKEQTVERGVLKDGVTESGSLEYGITSVLYDLDLDVDDDGEEDEEDDSDGTEQKYLKLEEVYVKTGQRISEGDILCKFTQDSISDVRMLLKNAAAGASADCAEARAEYNLSVLEAKTDMEILKLNEQYASQIHETSFQSVVNEIGMIQVEINKRTANISLLQEKLEEAAEDYEEAAEDFSGAKKPSPEEEKNTENYRILQTGYLNLQTRYENAKKAMEEAEQALEDNNKEMESLQRELADALEKTAISVLETDETYQESIINGDIAETSYHARLESLKETLQEAEDKKDKIEEQLSDFEAFVGEDGCLYADGAGIVTEVNFEAGDRLKETGTLISYAAPDDMTISVDVTQEDIVDLKVGDKVDITFTAYEDTSYEGSIYSIDTTATSRESNTVSYTVVIAVEGDTTLLYSGMTADIIFVTEQKEDVLYISRKAIIDKNGKHYVYHKTPAGEMELKEVETGMDNGINVEILSGLEEGDTIYLASRVNSENAVMSTKQGAEDGAPGSGLPEGDSGMESLPGGDFEGGGMPSFDGGMPQGDGGMPSFERGEMPQVGGGMPREGGNR